MNENVTVIEVVTKVTDQTEDGIASTKKNVSKLETAMKKVQTEISKIQKMGKIELAVYAIDNASKVMNSVVNSGKKFTGKTFEAALKVKDYASNIMGSVWNTGKKISGTVFDVTLKAVDLVTAPLRSIIDLIKNPIFQMAGIAGITFGVADTVNTYKDFEQQIANIQAVTGANNDEMGLMEKGIREVALSSDKSVIEIAENAKMVAESGGDIDLMLEQLRHGTNLATATQTDMSITLDFLGSAMKTFGMEAEDTQSVVDSLAYVTRMANVELSQLGESYVNAGGSAANVGLSIHDVNAALVTLSNSGMKGGSAGTSLNTIFDNLTAPTDTAAKSIKSLGVALYDTNEKSRNMFDIMSELEEKLNGMTDLQRNNYLSDIFDSVALQGWNYLVSDGMDSIRELSKELSETGSDFEGMGTAAGMAEKQIDTIGGLFSLLQRATDEFKLSIGEKAKPYISQFASWFTEKIPNATEAAGKAFEWAEEKVKKLLSTFQNISKKVSDILNSEEFQNTNFFGKASILWDGIIADPFDEWWKNSGKSWLQKKGIEVVSFLEQALIFGVEGLFGKKAANSIGFTIDLIKTKITEAKNSVDSLLKSKEWQNADTLWEKIKISWDKLITEPFNEWWNNGGHAKLVKTAQSLGQNLGSAVKFGISALFGLDSTGVVNDGLSIGTSFAKGFTEGIKGIDWGKVAGGIADALVLALKLAFSNPITGTLATAWIGGKVLSGVSGGFKAYQGTKSILSTLFGTSNIVEDGVTATAGIFSGISQGLEILKAAKTGNSAAESALAFAQSGKLGLGTKIGSAGIGGMALGAAGTAGGIVGGVTLISAATDLYKGVKSEDTGEEAAAYKKSAAWKSGGVAAGATIGAVLGSVIPGAGTAAGAGIGAGIGGWIGGKLGNNVVKKYEQSVAEAKEAEHAAWLAKEQAKYSSKELKTALADTGVSAEEFNKMFQKKVMENIQKRFGDVSLSLYEIQNMAEKITFGDAAASLKSFALATDEVNTSLQNLQNSSLELEKLNWKYEVGIEWTESNKTEFETTVQGFINSAQSVIQDKHYEAEMAFNLIMGESNASGIMDGLNGIYSDLQEQVNNLVSQMYITLPDGSIGLDEPAVVNNLCGQILEITNMVTQAQNETELEFFKVKYGGTDMDSDSFMQLQQELPKYIEEATAGYDEAFKVGLENLKLRAKLDVSFNTDIDPETNMTAYEAEVKKLTDNYLENINSLEQRVYEFQMNMIENVFSKDADKILTDLEGTLSERLQTALGNALTIGIDLEKMNSDPKLGKELWGKLLGLEEDLEVAAELGKLLTPVVEMMSNGFLDSLKGETRQAANVAYKIFKSDIEKEFSKEIELGAKIQISANTMIDYAKERFEGGEGSLPKSSVSDISDNTKTTLSDALTKPPSSAGSISKPTSKEQKEQPVYPNTKLSAVQENAEGGIFGTSSDLHPISHFTDSKGIMKSPHVGLVGEDGAEAIIPLSSGRRNRGISLWQKAGEMLGIRPYANGGIVSPAVPIISGSGGTGQTVIPVTIENVTFDVQIDGNGTTPVDEMVQVMKDNIANLTDEIAYRIALSLQQTFSNMPLASRT